MAARNKEVVLDADKPARRTKIPSGREIPDQGEYSFFDPWSLTNSTYVDGKPTRCSSKGFIKLRTYDPESGRCLIRREGRRTDGLAPYLSVEFFGETANKEATAAFRNMGGNLDLNIVIRQFDPNQPNREEPELELRASYHARAWPIQSNEDEFDRRERMWTNPHWLPKHLVIDGNKRNQGGHLIESHNLETDKHGWDDIHLHGCRERYTRDPQERLQQTERSFYSQGYLSRSIRLTHDPESEDILFTRDAEILLNHFHDLWDDQPHQRVRLTNHQTKEVEISYEPLTPEDLQALKAPAWPRLSDHADVLPAIDAAELKRLFDELYSELADDIIGSEFEGVFPRLSLGTHLK